VVVCTVCLCCRPSQQKHYPPSRRLLFHVLKGMPRLELSIAGLPTAAAVGELLRVQVGLSAPCSAFAQSMLPASRSAWLSGLFELNSMIRIPTHVECLMVMS
jgi:hypothetical protein